jgi:NAD(P)-dependent dehydrogenase (short-subunit alcohol dehydrogenase family)
MANRLQNKIVLVTGSTTGVGEATARLCVAEGARVMVHGLEEEWAKAVCAELGEASASYFIADIGDAEKCAELVAATIARFGGLDAVVNNAALTTRSTLESTDAAFFDRMISVNLRAPMLLIKAAVPEFRRRGGGTVVNIGSVNALAGQPNLLDYSISKGGLATMTRNLANALATERVRINQLNLGWVASRNEIALKISEGLPEGWNRNLPPHLAPRGYILEPHEIASHVVFWLSDESAPANGVVYELEQYSVIGRNFPKTSL